MKTKLILLIFLILISCTKKVQDQQTIEEEIDEIVDIRNLISGRLNQIQWIKKMISEIWFSGIHSKFEIFSDETRNL